MIHSFAASIDDFALEKTTKEEFAYVLDVYVLGALIVSKVDLLLLHFFQNNVFFFLSFFLSLTFCLCFFMCTVKLHRRDHR